MNVYFCDAGRHDVEADCIDGWSRYEPCYVNDVVFADTPGKAKSLFLHRRSRETNDLEYTGVKVHKLGEDAHKAEGVAV